METFVPPQLTVSGGIDELLDLLASGAPADAFEDFLDDARRFGVTGATTTDMKAAVWRAMRVHTQIQRGRVREAGLTALVDAARDLVGELKQGSHDSRATMALWNDVSLALANAFAVALFWELAVTAIGFSIRIVAFGITYGTSWLFWFAKIASFS